uniref:Uncharacterized protein n=1 Tax=Opuntia streptacantha TaxID=393608 RepID=A0A7C8ZAZ3_OPUST
METNLSTDFRSLTGRLLAGVLGSCSFSTTFFLLSMLCLPSLFLLVRFFNSFSSVLFFASSFSSWLSFTGFLSPLCCSASSVSTSFCSASCFSSTLSSGASSLLFSFL